MRQTCRPPAECVSSGFRGGRALEKMPRGTRVGISTCGLRPPSPTLLPFLSVLHFQGTELGAENPSCVSDPPGPPGPETVRMAAGGRLARARSHLTRGLSRLRPSRATTPQGGRRGCHRPLSWGRTLQKARPQRSRRRRRRYTGPVTHLGVLCWADRWQGGRAGRQEARLGNEEIRKFTMQTC